jgi:hypothetical protein
VNSSNDNPLARLWHATSIPLSIIGLSGLSDSLVKWRGFIEQIVSSYQSILYPLYSLAFGWFPFKVPLWVGDYLLLGSIFGASRMIAWKQTFRASPPTITLDMGQSFPEQMGRSREIVLRGPKVKGWELEKRTLVPRLWWIAFWPIGLVEVGIKSRKLICDRRTGESCSRDPGATDKSTAIKEGIHGVPEVPALLGFWQWLGAIAFGFVLLLCVNVALAYAN